MQFKDRLQYFRLKKGISEKDLGETLSITESSIRLYERGKSSVNLEHLNKLADFFKVSPKLLLGTLFPELSPEEAENSFHILQEFIEIRQREISIECSPDLSSATEKKLEQSSANSKSQHQDSIWPLGPGAQEMVPVLSKITSENILKNDLFHNTEFCWPLSKSIVTMYGCELPDYFYMRMEGDGMEPTIADQDIVLVNRQLEVAHNELAIIQYFNENATVRRISYSEGRIVLYPDNKSFASQTPEKKDCRVLGKVLWKAYYARP